MTDIHPALLSSILRMIGRDGLALQDFKKLAWLSRDFGLGADDHIRACNALIDQGFVSVVDDILVFVGFLPVDWLVQSLAKGEESAFQLVEDFPRRFWKFDIDQTVLAEIGYAGEEFVIEQLRERTHPDQWNRIRHVSLENDALGFDLVGPSRFESRGDLLFEVKTSFRPGLSTRFHLTRNEAKVGASQDTWYLVFVKNTELGFRIAGHLAYSDIKNLLPTDTSEEFQWSEVVGTIKNDELRPGLP